MKNCRVLSFGYRNRFGQSLGRSELLLEGLQREGFETIRRELTDLERGKLLRFALHAITAPKADLILLRYPYFLWLIRYAAFMKKRIRARMLVDAMVSHFDTNVIDRRLCRPGDPLAVRSQREDRLVGRCGDLLVIDTAIHGQYLTPFFGCSFDKMVVVPLGSPIVEDHIRRLGSTIPTYAAGSHGKVRVIYLGSYVPLHGIRVMMEGIGLAAASNSNLVFDFYGRGQDYDLAREHGQTIPALTFHENVDADKAVEQCLRADIVLGIFGDSEKAGNVVPYKLYDGFALGRPVITARTPAACELLHHGEDSWLVEATPAGIAEGLLHLAKNADLRQNLAAGGLRAYSTRFHSAVTIKPVIRRLEQLGVRAGA